MRGVKILSEGSRAFVRCWRDVGICCDVGRELRQRCVMSAWLFNVFFDGRVRRVKERMGNYIDIICRRCSFIGGVEGVPATDCK